MIRQLDLFNKSQVIKSTGYDQHDMLNDILRLHVGSDSFEIDTTYSTGGFYKNRKVKKPLYAFDKYPQADGVEKLKFPLPFKKDSVNSIVFDPPFVVSSGPSLSNDAKSSNLTAKRFSCFKNLNELFDCYEENLREYARILKPKGVLVVKTQDTVTSGKNVFTHVWLMNQAYQFGLYPKDLFILLARNRVHSGKHNKQQHARKFHSYFWVFSKEKPKVEYNNVKG